MILRLGMIMLISTLLATGCSLRIGESVTPVQSRPAVLDVRAGDTNNQLTELRGLYELYWNQLLEPADFRTEAPRLTGHMMMPSIWSDFILDGKQLPGMGYATYRLTLKVDEPEETKGLLIPIMYSNYKVWVDGRLAAVSGRVGADSKTSVPQKTTREFYFQPNSDQVEVIIQISNYDNFTGGMWEPIRYGPAAEIGASHDRKTVFTSILLGIVAMAGVYHIGLALFRRKDASLLYFGAFCLIVAVRSLTVDEVFLTKIFPEFPWRLTLRIEYICLYAGVPVLAMFFRKLFPYEFSKIFVKFLTVVAALYTVVTLLTPASFYYHFLLYYQILAMSATIYALFVLIWAVLRNREGAHFALVGYIIFAIVIVFDIFSNILNTSEASSNTIGVAVFTFCFSLVLSKKLSLAFNKTEQLAEELVLVNDSLDIKVRERTLELAESNRKLEELNLQLREWSVIDGLTGVYNRRYFDEHLSRQFEKCKAEGLPLAILLIDVDYFKKYNDTYGHLQGDECLREVAQTLRASLEHKESSAILSRYGGEEFAVILPGYELSLVMETAEELCEDVRERRLPHRESEVTDYVTISTGAACAVPAAGMDIRTLVEAADKQLYKAKSSGRNQAAGTCVLSGE
ncbi:diguanylate cyclase [Paenibacillus sp. YPG26]|uniref:sensor domain-containing diguanylate cyclase n=1 Tax=Paenibacillus sp. YPG26 TaxID=2878915 RepID=UPI0020425DDA|nr:diguanylate cyclase [Paenibacillus sp. YPG26]USB33226.1 GGDEF domain-containing protein [Paenibacillus sp. YPG26]